MRPPSTTRQLKERGLTRRQIERRFIRVDRGVWLPGHEAPSELEVAVCAVMVSGGVACGTLAGVLHGFDSVPLRPPFAVVPAQLHTHRAMTKRRDIEGRIVDVDGIPCTDALETLIDLAAVLDDDNWECALESALRTRAVRHDDLIDALGRRRVGNVRIRRVLARRPIGVPATESVVETKLVQLVRDRTGLPQPQRQVEVRNVAGRFVARVDFAWPDVGLFLEVDGKQHADQLDYDTTREQAVVSATGWFFARFRGAHVMGAKAQTARRLTELYQRAASRPSTG